ncbi:zinc finger protein ZAT5-like [Olea europaea var. sylvestris]|uniref:Zinc finger ZAT5-like n=1 Tax=Olea europaea subsp. europaea TaxID=158383 RepID=A0A8S0PHK1_OLEEU|nr:zinc finger protein ZAT5-like [Olea europaea var. sylvestris]CAA2944549.1 zinc finger ZAT5-like [Olea europaea subsp. europaea]
MEGQNEFDMAPRELSHLVKGKRTKRQRPQSPISIPITTHDPSSKDHGNHHNSSSSAESTTTEEEDTAKCLILLAQGHHFSSNKDDDDQDFKFNSKKYIEAGTCVFQCKTCNRTFSSFQALGGHRASHNKPRNTTFVLSDEDQNLDNVSFRQKNSLSSSLSLQLTHPTNKSSSSRKVHECSYCGAEFMSGQALGGHMRRHRGGPVATNTTLSLSSPTPALFDNQDSDKLSKKPRNGLSLDLNLPAPEDDPSRTFAFNSKKQQQQQKEGGLALYTLPTFVDCHY